MRIEQNQPMRVPILLVGEDAKTGLEGATVATQISVNGLPFQPTVNQPQETAGGWHYVDLEPEETATEGPLILVASAPEAGYEWRDIHQVEAPPHAQIDADQLAQLIRDEMEQWAVQIAGPVKLIRAGATG